MRTINVHHTPVSTGPSTTNASRHLAWGALACTAIASPTFLAFNVAPSATLLNQAAALIGWGAFLSLMLAMTPLRPAASGRSLVANKGLAALLAGLTIVLLAALAAPLWAGLPWPLSLSSAGTVLAAVLAALAGASLQRSGQGVAAFRAFCIGMVVAGIGGSIVGLIQVYMPHWADGDWIARSGLPGRAVGNLRQPNHLASLLLWAVIAAVWLGETKVVNRGLAWFASLLFVLAVVLTASRTGAVGTLLLAGWGVVDRRLSPSMRRLLWLTPLAYALFWWGNSAWADYSRHLFGGETRFSTAGDVSSSRFGIWANTLTLIGMHPWLGVGFGEFNFAWTLTPFPTRPVAFFDHTHNLILQFAVELGIPLAVLVLALLGWAFLAALGQARRAGAGSDSSEQAPMLRAAFMVVFMILLHSMLEYPLWYAYFLLPTAFALGLCLAGSASSLSAGPVATGRPGAAVLLPMAGLRPAATVLPSVAAHPAVADSMPGNASGQKTRPLLIAAMLLFGAGLFTLYDYLKVVVIFAPPADAGPLAQRIDDGRRSWFFAHHADYAAATTALEPPPRGAAAVLAPYTQAAHYLLDARLLQAWATALAQAGELDKARYVAARLREFRNTQAADFFAECSDALEPGEPAPFQCQAPSGALRFEDFR